MIGKTMTSPFQRLEQAQAFAEQKAWPQALSLLEGLSPLLRGEGRYLLAQAARECGRLDLALSAGQDYAREVQTAQAFLFVATTALRVPDHVLADQALEQAYQRCEGPSDPFFASIVQLRALVGEVLGSAVDLFARATEWYQACPNAPKAIAFYLQQLYIREDMLTVLDIARAYCQGDPDQWRVWGSYASAAQTLAELDEALYAHRQVFALNKEASLASNVLYSMQNNDAFDEQALEQEHVKLCQELWPGNGTDQMPALIQATARQPWDGKRRLKIGYVSGDFSHHSVGSFLISLFEHHDRGQFEIYCFSRSTYSDRMTERFMHFADHWRIIKDMDDDAAAQVIAQDEIDILVDLAGHTAPGSLGVFARRPAAVQVTWLGYPGITGLAAMDGRIADRIVDPCDADGRPPIALSGERSLHLPHGYHCWRPLIDCPDVAPLPEGPPVLGYYGSFNKVSKTTFDLWVKTLQAIPQATFRIKSKGLAREESRAYVRNRFAEAGVDPDRVIVIGWKEFKSHHMAAYNDLHLAFDPTPYNGTTTVCEALWMGVPSMSLRGQPRRRSALVTESLYTVIGQDLVDQFIAQDSQDFIEKVASLLADRPRLSQWRASLRQRISSSPLQDGPGFTRGFESALIGFIKEIGR
jgi:predicted O-linked N-acetylglucosamine transferase (SPINDLY family)